jgi:hypothetical protein
LAERAKSRADLLKNAVVKEQRITDLEQELKKVREEVAAEKKRPKDELAKEKRRPRRLLHSSIMYRLVGWIFMLVVLFQ